MLESPLCKIIGIEVKAAASVQAQDFKACASCSTRPVPTFSPASCSMTATRRFLLARAMGYPPGGTMSPKKLYKDKEPEVLAPRALQGGGVGRIGLYR